MPAGTFQIYHSAKTAIIDGTIDLDSDTIHAALFLSTSNCNDIATHNELGDLTDQHANANGYGSGGQALSNTALTAAGGVTTFGADPAQWSATGGDITARYLVLYKLGTANGLVNPLIAVVELDNTPADVTRADGQTFEVTLSSIFSLT